MIISYREIKGRIKKLWPDCRNIWLNDLEYEYPEIELIKHAISLDKVDRLEFRNYQFDCDDFALQLSADVNLYHGRDKNAERSWPFGQVMGRKFKGKKQSHTCNICILEDRIVLIEPQTDEIWEANSNNDDPYFIKVP